VASTKNKQTPFYEIRVYAFDSRGKTRDAKLTQEIKRLIDNIVITDAATSSINKGVSSLEITFKETAYLPQDSNLRGTSNNVHGQITNRPGAILDLRFKSEKGFTFVSKEEVERGKIDSNGKKEPLIYLFQSGNLIEVTWGYLDPYKSKTQTFEIKTISVSGGGSGDGNVTLTAIPPGLKSATKNKVSRAVTFLDETNEHQTVPLSLKQVVWKVAKANQVYLVFDHKPIDMKKLPERGLKYDRALSNGDSAPADNVPFVLPRNSTTYEFLDELAELYQAVVEIRQIRIEDPKIIKDLHIRRDNSTRFRTVLFFTPYRKIYNIKKVKTILKYRDTEGTILSYNIDDINGSKIRGATVSALTDDTISENSSVVVDQLVVPNKKVESKDNIDYSLQKSFKDNLGVSPAGKSLTTPYGGKDSKEQLSDKAVAVNSFPIMISLNVIGDTSLITETVKVKNIGTRYSGTYDIFSVVHNIGNHGYTCTLQGRSQYISQGGTDASELVIAKKEEEVKVKLVTVPSKA